MTYLYFISFIFAGKEKNNKFACSLAENLELRTEKLFCNISFVTAMFLHPNFKVFLNNSQKQKAKLHLENVYLKLKKLKKCKYYLIHNSLHCFTSSQLLYFNFVFQYCSGR